MLARWTPPMASGAAGDGSDQQDDAGGPPDPRERASSGSGATPMNDAPALDGGPDSSVDRGADSSEGTCSGPISEDAFVDHQDVTGQDSTFCERPSLMSATG